MSSYLLLIKYYYVLTFDSLQSCKLHFHSIHTTTHFYFRHLPRTGFLFTYVLYPKKAHSLGLANDISESPGLSLHLDKAGQYMQLRVIFPKEAFLFILLEAKQFKQQFIIDLTSRHICFDRFTCLAVTHQWSNTAIYLDAVANSRVLVQQKNQSSWRISQLY